MQKIMLIDPTAFEIIADLRISNLIDREHVQLKIYKPLFTFLESLSACQKSR